MTEAQKRRLKRAFGEYAGGPVDVDTVDGQLYVFGSELGVLRIFHRTRTGEAKYSANLGRWYYTQPLPSSQV